MSKLYRIEELTYIREQRSSEPFVLATGCFDIIHCGHIHLFEKCREIADRGKWVGNVMVGLNSDASVRQLKGESRPIHTYQDRAIVVAGVEFVDFVFEIDSLRVDEAIRKLKPTVWVKGGDYTLETLDKGEVSAAAAVGAKIEIIPAMAGYSTTSILSKL